MERPATIKLDLESLRRQDAAEFARLVKEHQHIVLGLCQSMGFSPADRDEAAVDVFAAVYTALPSFRNDSQLSTWVYRIALRTLLKYRRRFPKNPDTSQAQINLPDTRTPEPGRLMQEQEIQQRIWKTVARLDPDQAAAVELFYRRGMSLEQVAQVMEKPPGTIKTLLFRARGKLRSILAPLEELR